MTKNESTKSNAVADVVAEAEKLTLLHEEKSVPKQATSPDDQQDNSCDETDAPKASFRDRLKSVGEKLKSNKKGVIITLAVVGAAAVAVAKFTAKTVVEEIVENDAEEVPADSESQDDSSITDVG